MAPFITPWSVRPSAGMPSSAARAAIGPILHAPSSSEYSLWTWRWTELPADWLTPRSWQPRQMPPSCSACASGGHPAPSGKTSPAGHYDRRVIWLLRHGDAEDEAPDDASRKLT